MANGGLAPGATTTVLGKRKCVKSDLALYLTSSEGQTDSASEYEETSAGPSKLSQPFIIVNGTLVPKSKRIYKCSYEGCQRTYTKPSRLEEHERSHTGERPFVCSTCNKSYLRETHLQAHVRSHLPDTARPFVCEEAGCEKRFWTSQHLRVHADLHKGENPFKCTESGCVEAFSKHHQLRAHICSVHAPPGTKPYICEHDGCTKSFATNQKLRTHVKVHDEKRYTCVHLACLPRGDQTPTYFSTWTALQQHAREDHPPTCPHEACEGRTFTTQKGLKAHLKLHDQWQADEELRATVHSDGGEPPAKRRRGGEVGRDWKCEVEGCDKDFKSKKALTTHTNVCHLGRRDFVCSACHRAFGYKHLLQRHAAKRHSSGSNDSDDSGDDADEESDNPAPNAESHSMDIDAITGKAYATRARVSRALQCPYPHLDVFGVTNANASGAYASCEYAFSRAYDLRRHLTAAHGTEVEKDVVDEWVRAQKRT